jgi:hypothetical protein
MNRLSKEDLAQMNRDYFQSLDKEKLVEVAGNLHALAVEQIEKLEQNSSNSSLPPSSDQFRSSYKGQLEEKQQARSETSETQSKQEDREVSEENEKPKTNGFGKRLPGKQVGARLLTLLVFRRFCGKLFVFFFVCGKTAGTAVFPQK